jgi:CMP/dCMP kinase
MKYMIISFSGVPGSGKSTIAKKLAKELGWPRYYIGILRREAAKQKGLTLAEYNKLGEVDSRTDLEVDKYQEKLGQEKDNFIIEGRTSWHFIPHSLKIYLDVAPEVGAKRIFQNLQENNDRNEDVNLKTWQDVMASNKKRLASDRKRYQEYYNLDVDTPAHYDLFLDTSHLSIEEVFRKVGLFVRKKQEKQNKE